jgi:hypothetical protein
LCGVQYRDIQATDNPENFPGIPLALRQRLDIDEPKTNLRFNRQTGWTEAIFFPEDYISFHLVFGLNRVILFRFLIPTVVTREQYVARNRIAPRIIRQSRYCQIG